MMKLMATRLLLHLMLHSSSSWAIMGSASL